MYKDRVTINIRHGIHLRIAAEIVNKSQKLEDKYNTSLYIRKLSAEESIAISMLALISLKVAEGEIVEISSQDDGENGKKAVVELCKFIDGKANIDKDIDARIDDIIEESAIANEEIIQNIPVGVIVIDANSRIVSINGYGLDIIKKEFKEVIGKHIRSVILNSLLPDTIVLGQPQRGVIQHINDNIVIVNRAPIFSNGSIIGAIGVFQDISEMVGMKELNERFKKILECSHDLICFVDENRKVSYVNPAYEKEFPKFANRILGMDLKEISPNGLRMRVFKSKRKVENVVYKKGNVDVIATVEPIFIDSEFKGIISIMKTVDQLKVLMEKLEKSQEELNYYKDELKRQIGTGNAFKDIIGCSTSLSDSLVIAQKASKTTSTVLIRGESGTGKELIAKAIHDNSERKDKPFVRVNCAAIPENLLESELFGYEKGAFTGAVKRKPGKFNIADSGTIFLDEIGDMPKSMQVKLLRVLQEKEFESIGGLVTQKVDVRVIAATNRNLEDMIKSGEFREDLYYRLNVISIVLPPLRDRKEDINLLTEHFIKKIDKKLKRFVEGIDKECLKYLQEYKWPGNIRELENVIERAINMCDGEIITLKDLPFYITNIMPRQEKLIVPISGDMVPFEEYEKEIIGLAMKKYKTYNKAGKFLGLTHRTIALKCKKYGIIKQQ